MSDVIELQIQPEILDVDTSSIPKSLKSRFVELQNEVNKIVNKVSSSSTITPAIESALKKVVSAYGSASKAMDKYSAATDASKKSIDEHAEALERLKAKQAELQAFQANAPKSEDTYRSWLDSVRNSPGGFEGMRKSLPVVDPDSGERVREKFLTMYYQAKQYLETVDRLRSEISQLSAEEQQLANSIKIADNEIVTANAELSRAERALHGVTGAIEEEQAAAEANLREQQFQEYIEGVNSQARSTTNLSQRIATLRRVAVKTFSIMRSAVQRVASVVSSLASRISSLFKSFNKGNKGLNINTKKLFKTFLQFGLGVRSLYFLIRRMRTELINGMKQMAASFPEVNEQVSALTMAFNQLKGSAVTMVQPILATVIPVLIRLMNVLTAVMERIAQFFAILRGQKVIYKAAAANVDYAGSVDDVGGSAKEANKELAEYDNLLVIPQDNAGSGGGGGGGGADNPYGFEETPIDAVSEFAQKLKDAWEAEDFEEVGRVIADKLNSITQKVDDWILDTFEPKGMEWANRIARIGNGLFERWDAELAGKTVADFFNAIFNIVNEFVTTFNWSQAGEKIGTAIISALNNFDASKAGETVRNFFEGILNAGIALLSKNPGSTLGRKLAEFINSLFNTDSGALGQFIGQIINNVTAFFRTIFEGIDWENIKKYLHTNFNSLLDALGFDEDTKAQISKVFDPIFEVVEGLVEFFQKIDFEKVLGSILDLLGSISSLIETIWDILEPVLEYAVNDMFPRLNETTATFFDGVSAFLDDIGPLLSPLLEVMMELGTVTTELVNSGISSLLQVAGELLKPIAKILGKVLEVIRPIMESLSQLALDVINEALELLLSLLEPLEPILDAIFEILEPIIELLEPILSIIIDIIELAIKPLFHIIKALFYFLTGDFEAAGAEMQELLGDVGESTKKLGGHFTQLKDKFIEIWNKIKETLLKLRDKVVEIWNNIKEKVSTIVDGIKEGITKAWDNIKTAVSDRVEAIKTGITSVWESIKTWLSDTVGNIKDKVVGKFEEIKNGISNIFEGLKTTVSNIWNGIWEAIKAPINWILGGVEWMANGVVNGINALIGALNSIHFNIPEWVPLLGGKSFGFNIGYLGNVSLPRLAQGAVIPPNKEFLAVLGDQSNGTNIEAPLDTIKQALAEVMAEIGGTQMPEKIQIVMPNGKVLAETVWNEEQKLYKQTGSYSPRFA